MEQRDCKIFNSSLTICQIIAAVLLSVFSIPSLASCPSGANGIEAVGITVTESGCNINTSGSNKYGTFAAEGGIINLSNSTITTSGKSADGVFTDGAGTINLNNIPIATTGTDANGILMVSNTLGGNTVNINNASVLTSGLDAAGILMMNSGGSASAINVLAASNARFLARGNAPLIVADSGNNNIIFNNVIGISAVQQLLSVNTANLNLLAANSFLFGNTFVSNGGNANIIFGNTTYIGAINSANAHAVNLLNGPNSTWYMTGNSSLNNLINVGSINFVPSGFNFKSLTVNGGFLGLNGNVTLNTILEGDNSPSDLIVLNGANAGGITLLNIRNQLRNGATTLGNGILVVDAINGAITAPNSFMQNGEIVAGPYEYTLFKGGIFGSNPNNWYLRSIVPISGPPLFPSHPIVIPPFFPSHPIIIPPDFPPEFPIFPIEPPIFPSTPGSTPGSTPISTANPIHVRSRYLNGLPPGYIPNVRPIVSLDTAIPSLELLYDQMVFDTLHQRVGMEEQLMNYPDLAQSPDFNGGWLRVIGENGQRINGGVLDNGPDFNYDFVSVQGGLDLYHQLHQDHSSDFAGIFGMIGNNSGDIDNIFGEKTGTDYFNSYTGGFYWTHFGTKGWYVDSIAQTTFDRVTADSISDSTNFHTNGADWGLSVESGYPWHFINDYTLEPQAQLSYQRLYTNNAQSVAVNVNFDNSNSMVGRVGAMLSKAWFLGSADSVPKIITLWISANVLRQFQGNSTTLFSASSGFVGFNSDLNGNWIDLGAGLNAQLGKNGSIFLTYNRQQLTGGAGHGNEGVLGMRVNV